MGTSIMSDQPDPIPPEAHEQLRAMTPEERARIEFDPASPEAPAIIQGALDLAFRAGYEAGVRDERARLLKPPSSN
jgi:hypothetical protein